MSEAAVANLARWRKRPLAFVREVLGVEPDAWQVDVLEDLEDLDEVAAIRLAMVASKGPGKSTIDAWIVWWFLSTRTHAKVVCTSITEDNLKDGLWAELSKWQKNSAFLSAAFTWTQTAVTANESPETWFASARTWPKGGSTSQQADTLAGVHADHVLFIIDEAGGVPSAVAAAASAGLANASHGTGRTALFVLSGNPTHLEGPLYEACTSDAARWRVHRVNGDPDNPKRSPRVSLDWARAEIAKYGRHHPVVLVNVLGQFPPVQANKLLGPAEVQRAVERVVLPRDIAEAPRVLGVDVARFGDDASVVVLRQSRACFAPWEFRNLSTVQLAGQVAMLTRKHGPIAAIFVDTSGIGGGVYDNLCTMDLGGALVLPVDFGSSALADHEFINHRTEIWVRMAEWVKAEGVLPDVAQLKADLTGPTYDFARDGRRQLETKKEMKARGLASPDYGDALAVTFSMPVAPRQNVGTQAKTEWHPTAKP